MTLKFSVLFSRTRMVRAKIKWKIKIKPNCSADGSLPRAGAYRRKHLNGARRRESCLFSSSGKSSDIGLPI